MEAKVLLEVRFAILYGLSCSISTHLSTLCTALKLYVLSAGPQTTSLKHNYCKICSFMRSLALLGSQC